MTRFNVGEAVEHKLRVQVFPDLPIVWIESHEIEGSPGGEMGLIRT